MATEPGHHPNRSYVDQAGDFHLNGSSFWNDGEEDIAPFLESGPRYVDVQLDAAAVNGLLGANVELVAAPGAGLAVVPVAVHMFLAHGGTDFVQDAGTDMLALLYNGGAEITELGTAAQLTTLLEASADAALLVGLGALPGATPVGIVPEDDAAIDLDNNGATEYTTGDGTLSIRTYYKVVPFAAFGT